MTRIRFGWGTFRYFAEGPGSPVLFDGALMFRIDVPVCPPEDQREDKQGEDHGAEDTTDDYAGEGPGAFRSDAVGDRGGE